MEVRNIPLNEIIVSEFNTRKDLGSGMEDASLDDLADSIRQRGLINPVTVRPSPDGQFELIAGQRRFLACEKLGMDSISAIIREEVGDADATVVSLIENVHRAAMHPIDKARAYQKIYEHAGNYAEVAKQANVNVSTVKRYISLLNLAPSLQGRLSTSHGPVGVGTLSKLSETFDPDGQEDAIKEIGGFRQDIQFEMLRRSGGDIDRLSDLREEALEGAFDVKTCREGLCFRMSPRLKADVVKALEGEEETLRE